MTRVFGFHYELKDGSGTVLDSSIGADPFYFLENNDQIIPGLESQMKLMNSGDKKLVEVKAKDAYGEYREDLIVTVPKNQFPQDKPIKVGDRFQSQNEHGHPMVFEVNKIEGDNITINGNHPLAGKDLFFNVEIVEIRPATTEEVTHGHVHGPHGHHHH